MLYFCQKIPNNNTMASYEDCLTF